MIPIWYEATAAAVAVVLNSAANNIVRREWETRSACVCAVVLYVKFDVLFINDATLATVDRVKGSRSFRFNELK